MKLFGKRKIVVLASVIFLLAFFLVSTIPYLAAQVTADDCYNAYMRCLDFYWWTGPFAYPYCFNGYMFCLLFVA